ncbi:MAG: YceI family protein [Deltaproteobacteria bacterium]|nr:YceI family protein [Deltaproteobacteria bacterium]
MHLFSQRLPAIGLLALATSLTLASVGCDDPAKGKAKATASEAVSSAPAPLSAASSAQYTFDQSASKVSWVGSKVTGKHDGGFGTFKGTIDVSDGAPEKSKVDVEIDATSISSDQEKLTGHLKSPDFFDVAKHPKATFSSTKIDKGGANGATHTVTGNLTIKGISKSITFPATLKVDGAQASVDAEFAINRRDFSLNYAGMPNDLIRDDVVIKLTIRATKAAK